MAFIDLTGQRFGRLTAIERVRSYSTTAQKNHFAVWHCRCDCGKEINVRSGNLRSGNTTSCGCAARRPREHSPGWLSRTRREKKYGCSLCADKSECHAEIRADNTLPCRYAAILDPYDCYEGYERAAPELSLFPEGR